MVLCQNFIRRLNVTENLKMWAAVLAQRLSSFTPNPQKRDDQKGVVWYICDEVLSHGLYNLRVIAYTMQYVCIFFTCQSLKTFDIV